MDKVYASNEKKLITLNQIFQPVSDHDDRLISELSNFCGTIERDYVPLTCLSWHRVSDEDKDAYWDIVLVWLVIYLNKNHLNEKVLKYRL